MRPWATIKLLVYEATSVWGLQLLVHEALSYSHMQGESLDDDLMREIVVYRGRVRHLLTATSVWGLELLMCDLIQGALTILTATNVWSDTGGAYNTYFEA
jgi:hypothetical protein